MKKREEIEVAGEWVENTLDKQFGDTIALLNSPGENIDLLADVPEDQLRPLIRMKYKARLYRNQDLEIAIKDYLRLTVSKDRLGRKESVSIAEKVLVGLKETLSSMGSMIKEHT